MDKDGQDKLKQKLQVQSWDQVNDERGKQLVEQVQSGLITKEEWDYLRIAVPKFMDVVSTGLTTIGTTSTAIATTQTEALKAINEGIKAAREIACSSNDAAVKMKALETIEKGFERSERMNKENNGIWVNFLAVASVLLLGAARIASIGRR